MSRVLDALPDRPLTVDEAKSLAVAMNAQACNRITFDHESGEERVFIVNLLLETGAFVMLSEDHDDDGWTGEVIHDDLRDDEFYAVLEDSLEDVFGIGLEREETIWFDDDGDVIERTTPDEVSDE